MSKTELHRWELAKIDRHRKLVVLVLRAPGAKVCARITVCPLNRVRLSSGQLEIAQ